MESDNAMGKDRLLLMVVPNLILYILLNLIDILERSELLNDALQRTELLVGSDLGDHERIVLCFG